MSDYSRDETEFGAFEDPMAPFANGDAVGGFFDKVLGKVSGKKKLEAKLNTNIGAQLAAKGQSPAQVAAAQAALRMAQQKAHVTPKVVAKGMIQTAKIGAAVAAFVVPGGAVAGTAALGGLVAADKYIAAGQKGVAAAKGVIDNTKKLAAIGNVDAQRGLQMLGVAASLRAASGIAPGVPSPVNAVGAAAHAAFLSQRKPVVVAPPHPVAAAPARPLAAPLRPVAAPAALPLRVPMAAATAAYVARPAAQAAQAAQAAPKPVLPVAPGPAAHDWLVHDTGRVERIVRGNQVRSAGGYYVGPSGVQRLM